MKIKYEMPKRMDRKRNRSVDGLLPKVRKSYKHLQKVSRVLPKMSTAFHDGPLIFEYIT